MRFLQRRVTRRLDAVRTVSWFAGIPWFAIFTQQRVLVPLYFLRKARIMIVVIATVTCVPGEREAFLTEFHKLVPQVLNRVGCMEYAPTVDVESPFDAQHCDENRVTIVEKWSDVAALHRHQSSDYMEAYREIVADLVQHKELRILSATC